MRHSLSTLILAPAILFAAACGKDKPATDASLNNDLTLAAQARQSATLDSISAAERLNGGAARTPGAVGTTRAAGAVGTTTAATTHRTTTTHRARSSSSGNVSAGHEETIKHTNRDAAIGAVAGAAIGAATSHSVKGGLIGAAAGGILGGVIGNNVDKEKKRVP